MRIEIKRVTKKEEISQKMNTSIKPDAMKVPSHFPCAARVKMPQLGSEDSEIKIRRPPASSSMFLFHSADHSKQPVQNSYVKRISHGFSFDEDVIKDRCFHTLPYDSKYFWEVLSLDGLVPLPPKTRITVGRHNARGSDNRHMPCGVSKVTRGHQLKPLKRKIMEKAMQMHQQALMAAHEEEMKKMETENYEMEDGVFLTEIADTGQQGHQRSSQRKITSPQKDERHVPKKTDSGEKGLPKVKSTDAKLQSKQTDAKLQSKLTPKASDQEVERPSRMVIAGSSDSSLQDVADQDWDAYLLSILSPLTANWVVHERMSPSDDKENLTKMLSGWYGDPDHTDLVRDDVSVTDLDLEFKQKDKKTKKVKKEKELSFFDKIKAEIPKRSVDPYSDDNHAPFYRQPAGLRRQRKQEEREEAGAINSTAHGITVKSYQLSPPPTLRDFMNPEVGDKMYDTDNMFQQEWLTGSQQVFHSTDGSKIVLDNDNKYKKQLQKEYPVSPGSWYQEMDSDRLPRPDVTSRASKIDRGLRRWKGLPEPVDDTTETLNIVPPGYDPEFHRSPDPTTKRMTKQNASLMQIIGEWRTKWHLSGQFADSNPMDLIRDMADIQPHIRLKAIATVAKAAEYKPPTEAGIHLEYQEKCAESASPVTEEIFTALHHLLEDDHVQVQKAAAITLYSLNRPSDQAEVILREALTNDNEVDRWAAAQCLAYFGVCDSDVVGEIICQLLDTEDSIKHEQAIILLAKISNNSTLVHCMVAEQLNSTSWRHKVIACKILPTLHGTINKDITNKLSELMWNDWHTDVRKAAAQCLGKTQHGRDVHDDLKDRITSSNERIRLEAISRVGQLGIMTAKLLPAFLKCFDDPYVSVRVETCITSGNLEIQDHRVLEKLVYLATYDPIWKVKAISIQALGSIGAANDDIRECLMWALRYEEKAGVRAEACHSLVSLRLTDEEFIEVLQDRLLVETSPIVRDEMFDALRQLGVSTTEDMDMVAQIKGEVRKLCNRDVIASHIMVNEMDDDRRENLKRMVYETERELERFFNPRNRFLKMLTLDDLESRVHWLYSPATKHLCYEEHQAKKESVLKRIRSLSCVNSSGTQGRTMSGSRSLDSREGTLFTPSADKELEALMSREDTKEDLSDGVTPTTGSLTLKSRENTLTSASRPETSRSGSESQLSMGESLQSRPIKSGTSKRRESGATASCDTDTPTVVRMNSMDRKEPMRTTSEHGPGKTNLRAPSTLGLALSTDDARASKMSFIGVSSERKALLSRDTLNERAKVDNEAMNTYIGLESRYEGLNVELMALDRGLNTSTCEVKDDTVQSKKSEQIVASVFISSPTGTTVPLANTPSTEGSVTQYVELCADSKVAKPTESEPGHTEVTSIDNLELKEGPVESSETSIAESGEYSKHQSTEPHPTEVTVKQPEQSNVECEKPSVEKSEPTEPAGSVEQSELPGSVEQSELPRSVEQSEPTEPAGSVEQSQPAGSDGDVSVAEKGAAVQVFITCPDDEASDFEDEEQNTSGDASTAAVDPPIPIVVSDPSSDHQTDD